MGLLVFRSHYIPKVIGVLLMVGCFGNLFDSLTFFLLPNFGVAVAEYTFWGEIVLPLWLLIKGVNINAWEERRRESESEKIWTIDTSREMAPAR